MLARRTKAKIIFEGVDISQDINDCLLSLSYTDNEEDKTDDLQLTLDDRDGVWLNEWLNTPTEPSVPAPTGDSGWKIGDEVTVNGNPQYSSYGNGNPGKMLSGYKGKITHLNLKNGIPCPIHVDQKGWFAESQVTKTAAKQETTTQSSGAKGTEISAIIIQKNWKSDGKDKVLDCGTFQIDTVNGSGPPAKVTIKAGSIPYTSTIRTQKKTKAWESINLSAVANEIARKNGLKCMFLSLFDPLYERKEQVSESDIIFLKRICKSAGISLKVTAKIIVLFDTAEYEKKNTIRKIERGTTDVLSYSFSTTLHDTAYKACHVSYTNPNTKTTIEYTYTPRNTEKNGQILEVNEKVSNREEARQLAMKRLRQKNKAEFKANFGLTGDARIIAGTTVDVKKYGAFDGKYIVESATHSIGSSGYKTNIALRRVLEGY